MKKLSLILLALSLTLWQFELAKGQGSEETTTTTTTTETTEPTPEPTTEPAAEPTAAATDSYQLSELQKQQFVQWSLREELATIERLTSSIESLQGTITTFEKIETTDVEATRGRDIRIAGMKVQLSKLGEKLKAAQDDYNQKATELTQSFK